MAKLCIESALFAFMRAMFYVQIPLQINIYIDAITWTVCMAVKHSGSERFQCAPMWSTFHLINHKAMACF